jgi:hypothetical protein
MPDRVTLTPSDLDDIAADRRTPRVEELVRTSVVVGVPNRYLKTNGPRPLARRAPIAAC